MSHLIRHAQSEYHSADYLFNWHLICSIRRSIVRALTGLLDIRIDGTLEIRELGVFGPVPHTMAIVLMNDIPIQSRKRRKRVMKLVTHIDVWSGRLKGPTESSRAIMYAGQIGQFLALKFGMLLEFIKSR